MILRVFPRRTVATPVGVDVRIGCGPGLFDKIYCGPDLFSPPSEVHISVTFTWDLPAAERLGRQWAQIAPVRIGGPAMGAAGGDFEPGRFLRQGYVITSRGCPNRCWFCTVWQREGTVRELPIREGHNVLDDNLLACSPEHIRGVFSMLARQPERPRFTGGLEAKRLEQWHVEEFRKLKARALFFAYDTADDLEPLQRAGRMLLGGGFTRASHFLRCYVLCGYPKDTMSRAEARMRQALEAGFTPMAMLYRDERGKRDPGWAKFQRAWARPALIHGRQLEAR